MIFKSKSNLSQSLEDEKQSVQKFRGRNVSKIEAVYMSVLCFLTNCLSSVTLEAGGHSPLANTITKSAAFNNLFRRKYNLKIKILLTNVITSLTTTIMMTLGDKYCIPYLYVPWLVNTILGLTLCEGPALLSLAQAVSRNVTFPAASFVLTTFILYAEELFVWKNVFVSFRRCWTYYHYKKKYATMDSKDMEPAENKQSKLPCQDLTKKDSEVALANLTDHQRFIDLDDKRNSRSSSNFTVKSTKSTMEGKMYFDRNRFVNVTG